MNLRLGVALVAAVLFVLAGFTAWNEANYDTLRVAYMWFGLAMAASIVALSVPSGQSRS